jgi:tetratricopeptide (TPR) repeat protein
MPLKRQMEAIMGKLILCSGERTTRPYGFPASGIRIYSIEELCYYLYQHVYMIEEDMLSEDLFDWIGMELKLTERAEKLKQLKRQKADVKTLVTVILCSADYYTEEEIKAVLKILDTVIGMPSIKRHWIKANYYLKNGQYMEAATEYERIISSRDAAELTPEEYGDVYHNLAVAKVHMTGLNEASRLFCYAYERNNKEESLIQYLYTKKLCNNDSSYEELISLYQISEELDQSVRDLMQEKDQEIQNSEQLQILEELKQLKCQESSDEFYQLVDDMLEAWKTKIRQM